MTRTKKEADLNVVSMRKRPMVAKLTCSACGAAGEGSCDCNVAYLPPGELAARAIAANPEKSNRAIAAEIGVDEITVRRARQSGAANVAPDQRSVTGKDGKEYSARTGRKPTPSLDQQVDKFERRLVDFHVEFYNDFVVFLAPEPKLDRDHEKRLRKALQNLAKTCTQLSSLKQPEAPEE